MAARGTFCKGATVWVHMTRGSSLRAAISNPCVIEWEPCRGDETWHIFDATGTRFTINPFSHTFEGLEEHAAQEATDGS